MPKIPAGGPPFVSCPQLLIQNIRSYHPHLEILPLPQREDAPSRGEKEPLVTVPCRGEKEPLVTVPCCGEKEPLVTVPCCGEKEPLVTVPCRGEKEPLVTVPSRGEKEPLVTVLFLYVSGTNFKKICVGLTIKCKQSVNNDSEPTTNP